MEHQVILGREFIKALIDSGVVQEGERVQRVLIEADASGIVTLHTQRVGDDRLLRIVREGGLRIVEDRGESTA